MKKKFAVVKFTSEDDATAIISTNWLSQDKAICFYPNCPNYLIPLKKHATPGPDWKPYPVEVMAEDDNYSDARRHLEKSTLTSNLDSDEDDVDDKRKRNKVSRFTFDDSDDEDNNIKKITKKNKKHKVSAYPSLNSFNISSPSVAVNSHQIPSASQSHLSDVLCTQISTINSESASCPLISCPTAIVSQSSASSCPSSIPPTIVSESAVFTPMSPMSSIAVHPISSQPIAVQTFEMG